MVKRNEVALASFERLPPDLAAAAINEFLALISNELYAQAVAIFTGPGWKVRDAILPHLAALPKQRLEIFAQALYDRGLDVSIPGIEPRGSKPRR
jgi:hypothetical protein